MAAAAIANSLTLTANPNLQLSSGSHLTPSHLVLNLASNSKHIGKLQVSTSKRSFSVEAAYSDGGRSGSSSIFVSGFILGGLVVGTLGAVYAPQISKALAGADRKDLMRKLPKFIYDEDKALERTRKVLTEKIAQLNSAIDGVSGQLRSEDDPSEVPVNSDEVEALI